MEIIPKKLFVLPKQLLHYLFDKGVNVIIWAVSAVKIISDFHVIDNENNLPDLKYVMFSGEVMPVKSINYWIEHFKKTIFVNLYGPTEITCNCTYYILNREFSNNESLPIGKSFNNTRVYLLKDDHFITNCNEVGEICVEGTGLSLGYYNNEEKTNTSFVQCVNNSGYLNHIYKTGDLGYYDGEGNIYFANRADSQIKHMGHRIELGEIEMVLNSMSFIQNACCFYDQVNEKIYCIYQAEQDYKKGIVKSLGERLPKYMWPNKYVRVDQMPMNSHGKIDRVLLKKQYVEESYE